MQNINSLYLLQPLVTILFSVGLVVYWHYRRSFRMAVLVFSFFAYAGAIALKVVLQGATLTAFEGYFRGNAVALGLYFGIQTMAFEVGGAYLLAAWAVSRRKLRATDAEAFGLGLGLWENAGLLGALSLISLIMIQMTLSSTGPSALALYSSLSRGRPELFFSSSQALPLVAWGTIERMSSLLFHFSWGYLCLMAACLRKKLYLLLALPMGLVDSLVPFVQTLTVPVFELLILALALGCLTLTRIVGRGSP